MSVETGQLSINSENILPIIKKWLYSDKDIFIREMISNGCDAITKLIKLRQLGEAPISEDEAFKIDVYINNEKNTLVFSDNGIGMTWEEVSEYINQIAFSGAKDFISKYEESGGSDIIGHFGLGFYSAFMVSNKVTIDTLSYKEGAKAVKWSCEGGIEYQMDDGERTERGTTITLYLTEEEKEFLDEYTVKTILKKYCAFMPYEIYVTSIKKEDARDEIDDDVIDADDVVIDADDDVIDADDDVIDADDDVIDADDDVIDADDDVIDADDDVIDAVDDEVTTGSEDADEQKAIQDEPGKKEPKKEPVNDTNPLWLKQAKDCEDKEYKEFYQKVFMDFNEPLFYIHLNMDYPFRLKGILYFPRIKSDIELREGQVKLYNNQVYVADNIKEVIPEFLLLLKGVMDCPDLPLNVSRSFLQNDGYAKKMSSYIVKKVADKLKSVYKDEKDEYEGFWDDISVFIKYGCIKEKSFYEKVKDVLLFKTINGSYITLAEYLEKHKEEKKIYYVTDEVRQAQYIKMFKDNGQEAVILDSTTIDNPFISFLEMTEHTFRFNRIDSFVSESIKEEKEEADKQLQEQMQSVFTKALNYDKLKIVVENLKTSSVSAVMTLDEHARRMEEMNRMFPGMGMNMNMKEPEKTLVLNLNNSLVKSLITLKDNENEKETLELICAQIYDLALMGQQQLEPEAMMKFIERSNEIMMKLAGSKECES